jgi:hypothetical protein
VPHVVLAAYCGCHSLQSNKDDQDKKMGITRRGNMIDQ